MKKTVYEFMDSVINGDNFNEYSFDLEEIRSIAADSLYHLTDREKKRREMYIMGHEINIPEEYADTPVDELIQLLDDGEIECEEYDVNCGFTCVEVFYEEVLSND